MEMSTDWSVFFGTPTDPVTPDSLFPFGDDRVLNVGLIFFLVDTLVLAAMREKFRRGVISGSGAGAAALSGTPLPISGHSYEALV